MVTNHHEWYVNVSILNNDLSSKALNQDNHHFFFPKIISFKLTVLLGPLRFDDCYLIERLNYSEREVFILSNEDDILIRHF